MDAHVSSPVFCITTIAMAGHAQSDRSHPLNAVRLPRDDLPPCLFGGRSGDELWRSLPESRARRRGTSGEHQVRLRKETPSVRWRAFHLPSFASGSTRLASIDSED